MNNKLQFRFAYMGEDLTGKICEDFLDLKKVLCVLDIGHHTFYDVTEKDLEDEGLSITEALKAANENTMNRTAYLYEMDGMVVYGAHGYNTAPMAMMDESGIRAALEMLGVTEGIIIPSSVHEIILTPPMDADYCNEMIREVNADKKALAMTDVLSNHCYRYSQGRGVYY